jgi:hypothetical protein
VKGFLSEHGEYATFLELDHLRVMVAQPAYLLAMKCLALRIGAEFHDEDDIRSYEQALAVLTRYYPLERFPQKTPVRAARTLATTRRDSPLRLRDNAGICPGARRLVRTSRPRPMPLRSRSPRRHLEDGLHSVPRDRVSVQMWGLRPGEGSRSASRPAVE